MKKTVLILNLLLLSAGASAQWYYSSLLTPTTCVKFINTTTGFASTGFTVAKTTDGGVTWNAVAGASMDSIFLAMSFPTETTGYLAGMGGNLLKSTDGGNSWSSLHPGTSSNLWSVFFTSADTGYVAGENNTLLKTTNGGASWETLISPAGTGYSLHFINASLGFMTDNTRSIYRTQDGGLHWLEIAFTSPNKYYSLHFANNTTGFAVGMQDALTPCMLKSTDGGFKWTQVPVTAGKGLTAVYVFDDNIAYAAGAGGTIIKTTDGGSTWIQQTTPDLGTYYSICFTDANHGFAAGAALVRTDNGGGTNGSAEMEKQAAVVVWPNPTSTLVTIQAAPQYTNGAIQVFDAQGRMVCVRPKAQFPFEINVSGWPDGIYLVRIETGSTISSARFLKD